MVKSLQTTKRYSFTMFKKYLLLIAVFTVVYKVHGQVNASFTINYPSPNCAPAVVSFVNQSTGSGNLTYQWNFGMAPGVNSTQQHPSTIYPNCGNYTVTLTVTNGNGQQSTATQTVSIACNPVANFTVSNNVGCLPTTVNFTSTSSAGGTGTIAGYQWNFGNGFGSTAANPSHTYNTQGCKSVTLIVTNSSGCEDDTTVVNAFCPSQTPVSNFTSTTPIGCATPFNVNYTATPTGVAPFTYEWTFQGGTPNTSTAANPSVTYDNPGSFWTRLIVTGANGCKDTIVKPNYVVISANNAAFSINSTNACAPFLAYAQAENAQFATSITWTSSGGNLMANSGSETMVQFNTPGTYNLCMTITFPGNCTATKCTTIVVKPKPTASFTETGIVPTCQPPLNVTYTNTTTGTGLTYAWTFPGGNPAWSTAANPPTINYPTCGNFDAFLVVTNSHGCKDTLKKSSLVNIDCPIANFTVSANSGCFPVDVVFNSTISSGNPVAWEWNFGDFGNPSFPNLNVVQSTLQNPTHTYNVPGCRTVTLKITNAQGCTATVVKPNFVCFGTKPNLDFTASPLVSCVGQPISFTNNSTNTTNWTSWRWDFIKVPPYDLMSNAKNPTYTYADTGTFDVTLIGCMFGCCDTLTKPQYIKILAPVAKMVVSKNCINKFAATLNGSTSVGATSYSWSIPGANPSTSSSPIVNCTFPTTGDYVATLTVTNAQTGCTHSVSQTIKVRDVQADFYAIDTVGCAPFNLQLMNTSQDGNTWKWNVYDQLNQLYYTTNTMNVNTTIGIPGKYSVELIAIDVNGCRDTLRRNMYITAYGLFVNWSLQPTSVCVPVTAQFIGSVQASSVSTPVSYLWNFGDPNSGANNTATTLNATHVYNQAGIYTISLSVTDQVGCVTVSTGVDYLMTQKPNPNFAAVDSFVCVGAPVCFINNSQAVMPATFNWNFGNGNTSNSLSPCTTYSDTGTYTVKLTITDNQGCKDSLIKTNYIKTISPQANFVADTTQAPCPPFIVNFTSTSTGLAGNTTYFWDFGNGATSTAQNPTNIYTLPGNYTVKLIVTSGNGCSDTIVKTNYIQVNGATANVVSSAQNGCNSLSVCFNATQSNSVSYIWNFGNGTVQAGGDSICYTYASPGNYQPSVILNNGAGCSYAMNLNPINIIDYSATFTASSYYLCQNGTVQFTPMVNSSVPVTSYAWNFGDPGSGAQNTSTASNPSHTFTTVGQYLVTLTVTNQYNCVYSYTDTIFVTAAPSVSIVANNDVCPGTPISFSTNVNSVAPVSYYAWNFGNPSGGNNTSSLANPTYTYNNSGTYTVTVTITVSSGCTATATQQITVHQIPVANAGPDKAVCIGGSTNITGTGGVTYAWMPATGLSSTTASTVMANPTVTTTYNLVVTSANGCTASDAMVLTVNPLPSINAGPDKIICPGVATPLLATGAINYTWAPNTALSNSVIANPLASPTVATTYVVIGTSASGCTGSDTIVVNVHQAPVANAGNDVTICSGDQVTLSATGGNTYQWSPAGSLSGANTPDPVASPTITTMYTVIVTDNNGCQASDVVVVNVNPLPAVDAGPNQSICNGISTNLQASGAVSYQWHADNTLNNSNVSNPSAFPLTTTTYYVTGTDANGCSASDSVVITVIQPFTMEVGQGVEVCQGSSIQLSASGAVTYKWIPGNHLDNPYIPNPIATPTVTTTYTVIGTDGVCFQDMQQVVVTVNPLPNAYAGENVMIIAGETVTLNGTGTGSQFNWSPPAGLSCTDCPSPEATPTQTTTYILTVTNEYGCQRRDSVVVRVGCSDDVVFIPNAFSPNEDGQNDVFYVRSKGLRQVEYLRIHDRWGKLLFETNSLSNGWDGTYNGKPVNPGVYVYYLRAVCSNGQTILMQGNITLVK